MAQKRTGGQWGVLDQANNAPNFIVATGNGFSANGISIYDNLTPNTKIQGATIGVFGIDTVEKANAAGEGKRSAHAGWNLRTAFTGGRAGHVQYETLVTTKNISRVPDGTDDTVLPE